MSNDPIDIHVGQRLRLARKNCKMSQDKLADAMGVTFQQVQKYERGSNRVSASMLWRASHALGEPISYFFEGLEGAIGVSMALQLEQRAVMACLRIPSLHRVNELTTAQQKALHNIIESMLDREEAVERPVDLSKEPGIIAGALS